VQSTFYKEKKIIDKKLVTNLNILLKLLILNNAIYDTKGVLSPKISITPYVKGDKLVILFLFFTKTLFKFTKLFNSGLQSANVFSYILSDLRPLTKHSFREGTSALTLLQPKRRPTTKRRRRAWKSLRRKVVSTVARRSLTNEGLFLFKKNYMSMYGKYLTRKQRQARPKLPKMFKHRVL